MEILRTPRLVLRPFEDADAEFVLDLYSRWEVQQFIGRVPQVMTDLSEARERVQRFRRVLDNPAHGFWAITDRATGTPHGTLLMKYLPYSVDAVRGRAAPTEIGWHLHPDAWGHGYATEAAGAVLRAASHHGLTTVLAVTHPDNVASQAVAGRLGMRALGQTTDYYDTTCELFRVDLPEAD